MSTAITQSQAMNLEQRLNALERKVGVDRLPTATATATATEMTGMDSLDDRLSRLRTELQAKLSKAAEGLPGSTAHTLQTNESNWKDICKLMKELDPGIALTHQQQPLLYKRQQVLASCDELTHDFQSLDQILKLLLSGTKVDGAVEGVGSKDKKETPSTMAVPKKSQPPGTSSTKKDAKDSKTPQDQSQSSSSTSQTPQKSSASGTQLRLDQVTQAPILTQDFAASISPAELQRVQDLHHKLLQLNDRTKVLQATLQHYLECYHTTTVAVSEKIILADERISAKLAAAQQ